MILNHTTCTDARPLNSVSARLRRVVLMFVSVAVALAWTQSASASCGNYLFRNGQPVGGHLLPNDSMVGVHVKGIDSDHAPIQHPVRRCSGPNCSRGPVPLAPVPVAPANGFRNSDPAAILQTPVNNSMTRGAVEIPQSERGARFEPSSIFRPPAA